MVSLRAFMIEARHTHTFSLILAMAMRHYLPDEDTRTWNVETLNVFFGEPATVEIVQVPLSRHGGDNFSCWPFRPSLSSTIALYEQRIIWITRGVRIMAMAVVRFMIYPLRRSARSPLGMSGS